MSNVIAALLLALQAAPQAKAPSAPTPPAAAETTDAILARMLALYDEVCLQAFPSDDAIDALMQAKRAQVLTAKEVAVTLRDDPGRGWVIADGDRSIQVTLELPPYHACSVRRMTPAGITDRARYDALTAIFKATRPGFASIGEADMPMGDLLVHASGEARTLPDGGGETLLIYDQRLKPGSKGRTRAW